MFTKVVFGTNRYIIDHLPLVTVVLGGLAVLFFQNSGGVLANVSNQAYDLQQN